MREIKFRYIYQHQETGRIMSKIYSLDDIEQGIVKQNQRGYWIVIARDQFTGLIDKHGTDIYEGDIVRYADTEYPDQSYTDVIVYDAPEFTCKSHGLWCPFESAEYEIIGNIYENQCDHEYITINNEVVTGTTICKKCNLLSQGESG